MANVILYFGSFNPIHNGHTAVGSWVLNEGLCDELWFVVSPGNPLKESAELAPAHDRLKMAEIAVEERIGGCNARVSDVELRLPLPSYTIHTLRHLSREFPQHAFSLLMGADIMEELGRWKEHASILSDYKLYVYPRDGYTLGEYSGKVIYLSGAPAFGFSSTDVRRTLLAGGDAGEMVSPGVLDYIKEHGLWKSDFQRALERLDAEIAASPSSRLYLERGKLFNANGQMHKALNDLLKARELDPDNAEILNLITMIREIFAFRYTDYYNP